MTSDWRFNYDSRPGASLSKQAVVQTLFDGAGVTTDVLRLRWRGRWRDFRLDADGRRSAVRSIESSQIGEFWTMSRERAVPCPSNNYPIWPSAAEILAITADLAERSDAIVFPWGSRGLATTGVALAGSADPLRFERELGSAFSPWGDFALSGTMLVEPGDRSTVGFTSLLAAAAPGASAFALVTLGQCERELIGLSSEGLQRRRRPLREAGRGALHPVELHVVWPITVSSAGQALSHAWPREGLAVAVCDVATAAGNVAALRSLFELPFYELGPATNRWPDAFVMTNAACGGDALFVRPRARHVERAVHDWPEQSGRVLCWL